MAETRDVRVKLTLDASDYISGMNRAARATRRLAKAYRSLPREARMVARLATTHNISDQRLTDSRPRRMRGMRVH